MLQMPRLTPYESPFQVTLKGVAAGLVGTLVMTTALQAIGRVLPPPRTATELDSDDYSGLDDLEALDVSPPVPPTEQVAERLASQVFRKDISQETRQRRPSPRGRILLRQLPALLVQEVGGDERDEERIRAQVRLQHIRREFPQRALPSLLQSVPARWYPYPTTRP